MKWIIIVVVLLAAFGPVLWLVPSKKDRRLARMRQRARGHGLRVDIATLRDLDAPATARVSAGGVKKDPKVECAVYWANPPRQFVYAPTWRILRAPSGSPPSDGPLPGWEWDAQAAERVTDPSYWQRISEEVIDRLPADILAVEASSREVGLYWQERVSAQEADASVDGVAAILDAFVDEQRRVEAELEARQVARFEVPVDGPAGNDED